MKPMTPATAAETVTVASTLVLTDRSPHQAREAGAAAPSADRSIIDSGMTYSSDGRRGGSVMGVLADGPSSVPGAVPDIVRSESIRAGATHARRFLEVR